MKKYVTCTTVPEQLSKERLETIVNSIITTINSDDFNDKEKIKRIEIVLKYFGLINL